MFTYRHSLKSINSELIKVGHILERSFDKSFKLFEKFNIDDCSSGWRECGVYYYKKDAVDFINTILS